MTKDEIIETKAAWGKTFVEIIDPTKENHVFRAYFEQPQREWVGLTKEDMPDGEDPMFDHKYFIAGMVYADKVLKEKNK
jgi:hypothetical protein